MIETQSWTGRPSQWVNAALFFVCFLLVAVFTCALVEMQGLRPVLSVLVALPLIRIAVAYLQIRCWSYTLTDQRFRYRFGILSRKYHDVELYRIKDVVLDQPFFLRLLGLSNITIVGFDMVRPIVKIRAVRDGANVQETFRNLVEARRDSKAVRVSELG